VRQLQLPVRFSPPCRSGLKSLLFLKILMVLRGLHKKAGLLLQQVRISGAYGRLLKQLNARQ
jgi:hypothetical protein